MTNETSSPVGIGSTDQLGVFAVHRVNGSVADQCRALGLNIGDTIEGTEGWKEWWNTTRLTLLWLGETEAVWRVTSRTNNRPQWSTPREAANWTLSCRDWRRVDV